jgi:cobalt-zinc-cadmium efflux system outer membrane protein
MKNLFLGLTFLCAAIRLTGQNDTIYLTLPQAEAQFLQKNLVALAQKYNIDIAEAAVTQAKCWDNPNLQIEINAFNPNTKKVFPIRNTSEDANNANGGDYTWQLQQVINLAKNRSKLVALNESNVGLQQVLFQDLMRTLRYQVAQTFGNLAAEQQQIQLLNRQKQQLQSLVLAYKAQLNLGVVSEFEVTRLELEQRNSEADIQNLLDQISRDEATLRVLLASVGKEYYLPQITPQIIILPALNQLMDQALINRTDVKVTESQITVAKQNLVYQQAIAIPRLMLGVDYQRYGSAYPSYYGLQMGIDLPVLNRNQGNIQAAKLGIDQNTQVENAVKLQVKQDVISAYEQVQHAQDLRSRINADYLQRVEDLNKNTQDSYAKRLIDFVSFIDKMRAYKDAKMNFIMLNNSLFQAQEQLRYVTNSTSLQ